MPSLANLVEDYRNWRGRQEWEQGKGWQDFFGGDPRAQEQFEKLSGFGTDAGGLVGMIKASHGSPHAFDRFDFSKIGTGEGNQSYGHGGYFAQGFDSPVAKEYQKQLAADVQLKGQPFYSGKSGKQLSTTGNPELDDYLMANLGDVNAARANLLSDLRDVRSGGGDVKDYQQTLADLRNIRGDVKNADPGHLYNVELKWPDAAREASDPLGEHHLLDWDETLANQPESVKSALSKLEAPGTGFTYGSILESLGAAPHLNDPKEYAWAHPTGRDIYNAFGDSMMVGNKAPGQFEASNRLRNLGIPGIRYLDQASRGAGSGTRNYVMFDDKFPNIVSRNGASLSDLLPKQSVFDLSFVPEGNKIRDYKIGNSTIVLDARPDKIGISSIRTPVSKRGQGSAKNALSQLVEQADAEGIPLSLSASPLDKKTSLQKLFDFYQSMGFEPTGSKVNVLGHPEMIRYPKEQLKK